MMALILLMGFVLYLTGGSSLAPQLDASLSIWAVVILPTTIVISSLSFALGTLFPRHPSMAALGVIVAWYLPTLVLSFVPSSGWQVPLWYKYWEPTNIGTMAVLLVPYQNGIENIMQPVGPPTAASDRSVIHALQVLEQKMPNLLPWLLPHLVWAAAGLALVLIVAFTFKRFRGVLNG